MKKAGADSFARRFCSCYARNVNACWAFLKLAGGFFLFFFRRTAALAFQDCPDMEGSEKIQARESSEALLVIPYALQPKTARGVEAEGAWMVIFRV